MSPFAQSDGHDAPWLIGEAVPGEAAMVEDVVLGFEHAVRQPVVAHELPNIFDRVELGYFAGSGSSVMLSGTTSPADRCQPA